MSLYRCSVCGKYYEFLNQLCDGCLGKETSWDDKQKIKAIVDREVNKRTKEILEILKEWEAERIYGEGYPIEYATVKIKKLGE